MVLHTEKLSQESLFYNGIEVHAYSYKTDTISLNHNGEYVRLYIYTLISLDGNKVFAFSFHGKV